MADPTLFQNGFIAFTTATGSSTYVEMAGVKEIHAPFTNAELDDAIMGDTVDAKYPGIMSRPIDIVCRQDFATAAAGVDKFTNTRQAARTAFRAKIRPVDAAVSSTNPSYIYNRVFIFSSTPIDGTHGQLLVNKIGLRPGSGGTITRSTAT